MTLLLQQNRAGFCAEHLTQADMPPSPSMIYSLFCTFRRQTLDDNEWEVPHATRAL